MENLVAVELLKYCTFLREIRPTQALEMTYLRTKTQKEVDFLLLKQGRPYLMLEVKTADEAFSKNLIYFL